VARLADETPCVGAFLGKKFHIFIYSSLPVMN